MGKKKIKRKNKKTTKQLWYFIGLIICIIISMVYGDKVLKNNEEENIAKDYNIVENQGVTYFNIADIPEYTGEIYVTLNNNIPYFEQSEYKTEAFETYSKLDDLGRCGVAYANICKEIMPTNERGDISSVKPTGWVQEEYNGEYLYNRCHLIGYQLAGENDNELNLITGTKSFNVKGMLPFENRVADYIKQNPDNHVLYRVTPIFKESNLLASGVEIEAYSVEDNGQGVCFNVYIYNVEHGIYINYATGESSLQ